MSEVTLDSSVSSTQIWLTGIAVFIFAYNYLVKESWKKLPPGPPTLPLVGSLPFLGSTDIREPLRKLTKKYGDVFTIYLGRQRVVVLNGYEAIYEAFVKNAHTFSGRPKTLVFSEVTRDHGIAGTEGDLWREQRRYALHVLRDFGFGRTILEDRILEEVNFFIKEVEKNTNKPFYPHPLLRKSVANVIASVTFGKRMDYEDPVFTKYMEIFNRAIRLIGNSGIANIFPFVRYLPGDLFQIKQLKRDFDYLYSEYDRIINEHKEAAREGKQTEDFISSYLKKIEVEKEAKDSSFTERQLASICNELFAAGAETTSATLAWSIIFMSLNPETQRRVHAEIDDVIGCADPPAMSHRSELPFTEACLLETQRLGDLVPLGVPHAVSEDVYFRGYFIPKRTIVMANMYAVHMNPDVWPEPEMFKPDRFLDSKGKIDKKELIPFGLGKRVCLGESLARMELFLYFTSMMQHFRFRTAPGLPAPSTKGVLGISNTPEPFHVIAETRNQK